MFCDVFVLMGCYDMNVTKKCELICDSVLSMKHVGSPENQKHCAE